MATLPKRFGHANDWEGFAVAKRDGDGFDDDVATEFVERDTSERGTHFEAGEAGGFGGVFAGFEEECAEAAASPIRMDEDGADFCGVVVGIQEFGFADGGVVGAKESFAFAPAAAGDDGFCIFGSFGFGDEVGLVGDELCIEAEDSAEGAFDLRGSVVSRLEDADGRFDEGVERWDVGWSGEADMEARRHKKRILHRVHGEHRDRRRKKSGVKPPHSKKDAGRMAGDTK